MMFPYCNVDLIANFERWNLFFHNLKSYNKTLDKHSEELVSLLQDPNLNQDSKDAIQFAALSALFPPRGIIVEIPGDIESFIERRKDKLYALNVTVQPYLIVVGNSFSTITDFYLVIDSNLYKTETVLGCIDLEFRAFHVLHAQYPHESEHIWLLLQKKIYKLETPWDKKTPYVETMVKELNDIQSA